MRNWLRRKLGITKLEGSITALEALPLKWPDGIIRLTSDQFRIVAESIAENKATAISVSLMKRMGHIEERFGTLNDNFSAAVRALMEDVEKVRNQPIIDLAEQASTVLARLDTVAAAAQRAEAVTAEFIPVSYNFQRLRDGLFNRVEQIESRTLDRKEIAALLRLQAALKKSGKKKLSASERAALEAQ